MKMPSFTLSEGHDPCQEDSLNASQIGRTRRVAQVNVPRLPETS